MGFFNSKKEKKNSDVTRSVIPEPVMPAPPVAQPEMDISDKGKLIPPSIPGTSHLDDIKLEVTSTNNLGNENKALTNTTESLSNENVNLDSDSLFDLSDLDLSDPVVENIENQNINSNVDKENDKLIVDPSNENLSSLNFATRSSVSNRSKDKDIYVTTSQFKTLLSIIDSVKSKVKGASETHLRLMDIKSEEDIEYENLRKAFQFVEDKLYEVDNLIFEK